MKTKLIHLLSHGDSVDLIGLFRVPASLKSEDIVKELDRKLEKKNRRYRKWLNDDSETAAPRRYTVEDVIPRDWKKIDVENVWVDT